MQTDLLKSTAIALAAGVAATAIMTLGQKAEQSISGRESSNVPAKALEKFGGVTFDTEAAETEASTAVHWGYGVALGLAIAPLMRLEPIPRLAATFAGIWALGAVLETVVDPDRPPTAWDSVQILTDAGHHLVYSAAAVGTQEAVRMLFSGDSSPR